MHPFFDTSKLDEETLNKKIIELQSRLQYAYGYIGDQQMIQQLQMLLEQLEAERMERYEKEAFELWEKQFPKVIESDPEFAEAKQTKAEPAFKKPKTNSSGVTPVFAKTYRTKSTDDTP